MPYPCRSPKNDEGNRVTTDGCRARERMSLYAISEAWDKSRAEGATLLLLLALADFADDEGVCFPSEETLAARARVSLRSVRRYLGTLKALDEIEAWEWFDRRRQKRNCYRILIGRFASFKGIEPPDIAQKSTILRRQIPTATRRRIFVRDGYRCLHCDSTEMLTIDHVIPVSKDGGDEDANLQTLCRSCNQRKSDGDEPDRLAGSEADNGGRFMKGTAVAASQEEPPKEPVEQDQPLIARDARDVPPKLVKVGGRDQAFDALAEACGVDPNGNRAREVGIALNGSKQTGVGIRTLVWPDARAAGLLPGDGERFERFVVGAIQERARQYRERMNGAMLTPLALAKWWTDIANSPAQPHMKFGRRDVSAAEMLAAAERLEHRKEIESESG